MLTDITIIGGGIVGIATAYELPRRFPGISLEVLETEQNLACTRPGKTAASSMPTSIMRRAA